MSARDGDWLAVPPPVCTCDPLPRNGFGDCGRCRARQACNELMTGVRTAVETFLNDRWPVPPTDYLKPVPQEFRRGSELRQSLSDAVHEITMAVLELAAMATGEDVAVSSGTFPDDYEGWHTGMALLWGWADEAALAASD